MGWLDYFTTVIGEGDFTNLKPSPDGLQQAATACQVSQRIAFISVTVRVTAKQQKRLA